MRNPNIIAGLDIGSSMVRVVIAEIEDERLKIVGIGKAPSGGIRRGVVVNLEKTIAAISQAVKDAEAMAGVKVSSVFVSIGGDHIRSLNSRGIVAVSRSSGEITHGDIARAIDAARAVAIPMDREIIHTIPQEFTVDDQTGIKDPTGMSGVRLEVDVHIVTAAGTSAQNLFRAVKKAELEVEELVLTPLASAAAALSEDERELGSLLIDFGGGTTDLAVFYDGSIRHSAVIGLGGKSVTNDIAIGLRIPLNAAEQLKIRYGCALSALIDAEETLALPNSGGRSAREISRSVLTAIIEPRVEEIFRLALRELRRTPFAKNLSTGIVLTGGAATMPGVLELCEKIFNIPAKIGVPQDFSGLADVVNDPGFTTALGLLEYGLRDDDFDTVFEDENILTRWLEPILKLFRKKN